MSLFQKRKSCKSCSSCQKTACRKTAEKNRLCVLISGCKRSIAQAHCHSLVARPGLEPGVRAYEARVLPLHYRTIKSLFVHRWPLFVLNCILQLLLPTEFAGTAGFEPAPRGSSNHRSTVGATSPCCFAVLHFKFFGFAVSEPENGIEPLSTDYKSAALPLCYTGFWRLRQDSNLQPSA